MTDYDVYPTQSTSEQDASAGEAGGPWHVLVEYANNGQAKPPTKIAIAPGSHSTREAAMVEAERRAFTYDPPDPLSPQGRQVYRDGDGFLTVVQGAMSTFHFSTRAVRRLEDPPT